MSLNINTKLYSVQGTRLGMRFEQIPSYGMKLPEDEFSIEVQAGDMIEVKDNRLRLVRRNGGRR